MASNLKQDLAITVFTPTFNRAETLPRVFRSLVAQTLPPAEFEWLVVDDGSSDGTAGLVKEWGQAAPFRVTYAWQNNGGKHRAWNRALREARGELFVVLDSDDGCVPNALERVLAVWRTRGSPDYAGVLARCNDPSGNAVGATFPPLDSATFSELTFKYGMVADLWSVDRTSVLREFPFPEETRAKYVPEGMIWHLISTRHKWLLLDEPLRIYYSGAWGRTDQLSRYFARPLIDQAPGMAIALGVTLGCATDRHLVHAPGYFLRAAANYVRFLLHEKRRIRSEIRRLPSLKARLLCMAMAPAGILLYVRDWLRGGPRAC